MGQGSSQLLTHMWIMKMAHKPWYITKKGKKKERRKERLNKYNSRKKGRILNH